MRGKCSDDNRRNHQHNQPTVTRVPIATNEENVPLSPPPAYTPSISDLSEENTVSTPPPPSYETQIRQIDEQEPIPTSPPPPYPLTPT